MAVEAVTIPEKRKPALIGREGKTKAYIEKKARVRISVRDEILVEGEPEDVMAAREIVKAIGRGFTPKEALELLNEGCELVVISLAGETDKTIKRLMGRVIGRKGASKRIIERETGALVAVMGKTVSLIGDPGSILKAREAVEELLSGRSHGYVYRRLRK